MQWARILLSGTRRVCVSGQEGETDPLSSLELAHSQESVTWVSQPKSARRDCLALYVSFPWQPPPPPSQLWEDCWPKDSQWQWTHDCDPSSECCKLCCTQPSGMSSIQGASLPVWPVCQPYLLFIPFLFCFYFLFPLCFLCSPIYKRWGMALSRLVSA